MFMDQQSNGKTVQHEEAGVQQLRETLSKVYHDINNPLAIISGNAQLLLEMAHMMGLDDQLVEPIEDIEEASRRLNESLGDLERLQKDLPPAN